VLISITLNIFFMSMIFFICCLLQI
jgi:hypothetical protein